MSQSEGVWKFVRPMVFSGVLIACSGAVFAQQNAQQRQVPDAQVEANVLKALAGVPQLADQSIQTTTVYGVVTLSGVVPDEPTRVLAENLASRAEGVQKVIDELTLGSPAAAGATSNAVPQSDGSMPPPPADGTQPSTEHAPSPDVYAQTHPNAGQQDDGTQPQAQAQPQPQSRRPLPTPYGAPPPATVYVPGNPYGGQQAGIPVTIPTGSMLRVRLNQGLDGQHTPVGTGFDAVVLNDVVASGEVAIPRGAIVHGTVVDAKAAGALKGRGELAIELDSVVLAGKVFPLVSNPWTSTGPDKTARTVNSTIGLSALGAIIGGVAGGGAGAAIGAGAGAAAGVGASAASPSGQAFVPPEAILTFQLVQPAPVVTVSQAEMDRLGYGVPVNAQRVVRRNPYGPYYAPGYYPAYPPSY